MTISFQQFDPNIGPLLQDWLAGMPSAKWAWSVLLADFFGDGYPAIFLGDHGAGNGGIILRRANSSLDSWCDATPTTGLSYSQLPREKCPLAFDFDNDGRPDLVPRGAGYSIGNVLKNMGNGVFAIGQAWTYKMSTGSIAVDDNEDGWLDVVNYTVDYGKLYRQLAVNNGGNGTFSYTSTQVPVPGDLPQSVRDELLTLEADVSTTNRFCGPQYWAGYLYDAANRTDAGDMIVQYGGSYTDDAHLFGRYLFRNLQTGSLEDKTATCGIPATLLPIFNPADVYGDGRLAIVCGYGTTALAGLYRQVLPGQFELQRADALPVSTTKDVWAAVYASNSPYVPRLHWIDLDFDGKLDLVVDRLRLAEMRAYQNTGSGLVEVLRAPHADGEGLAIGDIDGDGKLDLVTFGTSSHVNYDVKFWLNASEGSPPPPPPPGEIVVKINGAVQPGASVAIDGVPVPPPTNEADKIIEVTVP